MYNIILNLTEDQIMLLFKGLKSYNEFSMCEIGYKDYLILAYLEYTKKILADHIDIDNCEAVLYNLKCSDNISFSNRLKSTF